MYWSSDEVNAEKERLIKQGVDLSWLHSESVRLTKKCMKTNPNTWATEVKKWYTYTAVTELINERR